MNDAGISGEAHLVGGSRVLLLRRELLKGALLEWAWPVVRLERFIGKRALLLTITERRCEGGVMIKI